MKTIIDYFVKILCLNTMKFYHRNIIICLFSLSSLSAYGQEINFNEEFEITYPTNSPEAYPSLCCLDDGTLIISWIRYSGVNARAIYPDFSGMSEIFKVSEYSGNDVSAASLDDGGFVIVWATTAEARWHAQVQIYNPDLTKRVTDFASDTYAGYQRRPSVAALSENKFVVVSDSSVGGFSNIRGHIFDARGNSIGEDFKVNTHSGAAFNPKATKLNDGGLIVVWESRQDGSEYGVYGQVFDENYLKSGDEFLINTQTLGSQGAASIATLNDGKLIVAWKGSQQDGSRWGVFAQAYNPDISKYGEEFQVNTYSAQSQTNPHVTGLKNGGFVAVWESFEQDGFANGIYCQMFDSNLNKFGKEFLVNDIRNGDQTEPSVCQIDAEKFLVIWRNHDEDSNINNIAGKYFLSTPTNHSLEEFDIIYPELDETISEINPQIKWERSTDAHLNFPWEVEYDLYVSEDLDFENPLMYENLIDTSYRPTNLNAGKTYFWKVLAKNFYGDTLWSKGTNGFYIDPNAIVGLNSIDKYSGIDNFNLAQNYPNPFNPSTFISYKIPSGNYVSTFTRLNVFTILGEHITTLVNEKQPPGNYEIEFNGSNLPSGIYFYRLNVGNFSETKKMILIK